MERAPGARRITVARVTAARLLLCAALALACSSEPPPPVVEPRPKPSAFDPFVGPLEKLDRIDLELTLRSAETRMLGMDCEPGTEVTLDLVFDRRGTDPTARLAYAALDVKDGRRLYRKGPLGGRVKIYRVAAWRPDPSWRKPYYAVAHFDRYAWKESYALDAPTLARASEAPWPPSIRHLIELIFGGPSTRPAGAPSPMDRIGIKLRARGSRVGSISLPGFELALDGLDLEGQTTLVWDGKTRSFVAEGVHVGVTARVGHGRLRTATRMLDVGRGSLDITADRVSLRAPYDGGRPTVRGDLAVGLWLETTAAESHQGLDGRVDGHSKLAARARFGLKLDPSLALELRDGTVAFDLDARVRAPRLEVSTLALDELDAQTHLSARLTARRRDEARVDADATVSFDARMLADVPLRAAITAGGGTIQTSARLAKGSRFQLGARHPARVRLGMRLGEGPAATEIEHIEGDVALAATLGALVVDGPEVLARAQRATLSVGADARAAETRATVAVELAPGSRLRLPQGDEVKLAEQGGRVALRARLTPIEGLSLPRLLAADGGQLFVDLAPFSGRFLGHSVNAPAGARAKVDGARLEVQRDRYRLFGRVLLDVEPAEHEPILTIDRKRPSRR